MERILRGTFARCAVVGSWRAAAALAAALLLAVLAPASAQESRIHAANPFVVPPTESLPVSVRADHAFAMALHRQLGAAAPREQGGLPPLSASTYLGPWLWASADGELVRRLDDGTFLITVWELDRQFHRDLRCQVTQWPDLQCTDRVARKIAAPTPEIMLVDGVEYRRRTKTDTAQD